MADVLRTAGPGGPPRRFDPSPERRGPPKANLLARHGSTWHGAAGTGGACARVWGDVAAGTGARQSGRAPRASGTVARSTAQANSGASPTADVGIADSSTAHAGLATTPTAQP